MANASSARAKTGALLLTLAILSAGCTPAAAPEAPRPSYENPLAGLHFYVDPLSHAAIAERALMARGDRDTAEPLRLIAQQPTAHWLTGAPDDAAEAARISDAAKAEGTVPAFVLYNLPDRDVQAGKSSGGAADGAGYLSWLDGIQHSLEGSRAIVIVEPDALSAVADQRMDRDAASERMSILSKAVTKLSANPSLFVYLDAGNPGWHEPAALVQPLKTSGVDLTRGIAVNVANFFSDEESTRYGQALSALLGGTGIVIDTSRNGNGAPPQGDLSWCNPPGRALGRPPAARGRNDRVQAWLWVKTPGDSDGSCRPGEPEAGRWWLDYAVGLATTPH